MSAGNWIENCFIPRVHLLGHLFLKAHYETSSITLAGEPLPYAQDFWKSAVLSSFPCSSHLCRLLSSFGKYMEDQQNLVLSETYELHKLRQLLTIDTRWFPFSDLSLMDDFLSISTSIKYNTVWYKENMERLAQSNHFFHDPYVTFATCNNQGCEVVVVHSFDGCSLGNKCSQNVQARFLTQISESQHQSYTRKILQTLKT